MSFVEMVCRTYGHHFIHIEDQGCTIIFLIKFIINRMSCMCCCCIVRSILSVNHNKRRPYCNGMTYASLFQKDHCDFKHVAACFQFKKVSSKQEMTTVLKYILNSNKNGTDLSVFDRIQCFTLALADASATQIIEIEFELLKLQYY